MPPNKITMLKRVKTFAAVSGFMPNIAPIFTTGADIRYWSVSLRTVCFGCGGGGSALRKEGLSDRQGEEQA